MTPPPTIDGISPFFIVRHLDTALAFYRDLLGFAVTFRGPEDDPFFGIVRRDGAMILLKDVRLEPLPNCKRDAAARWDAYLSVADPDALAAEFTSRGVLISVPLKDTDDGLRGFELKDTNGYVLFFGCPRADKNSTVAPPKPGIARPQGGICSAWGVNPRWGRSHQFPSPAGPAWLS